VEQQEQATVAIAADKATVWSNLAGIVDRPAETLGGVYRRPRWAWLGPLLIVFLALAVFAVASTPYTVELAREQVRRSVAGMSEQQAAMVLSSLDRMTAPIMGVTATVGGLIAVAIGLLVATGVLYFAGLVSGTELNFVPLLSMMAWTWIPFAVRHLVQAGFILVRRGLIVNQGLSWLVSVGDPLKDAGNIVYYLLGFVDVFMLWHLILVWAGTRGAGRLSWGRAFVIAIAYAAVNIGLGWIPVAVSRIFTPALGG